MCYENIQIDTRSWYRIDNHYSIHSYDLNEISCSSLLLPRNISTLSRNNYTEFSYHFFTNLAYQLSIQAISRACVPIIRYLAEIYIFISSYIRSSDWIALVENR